MAFVVIQCDDVSLLKRFLVAVSFSSVSSSLLTQLPFEHALLSINENNYLLVPNTVPPEIVCLLPAVQKQIVIQVRGLESCLVSVTIHGGHVKDDYFSGNCIEIDFVIFYQLDNHQEDSLYKFIESNYRKSI